MAYSISHMSKPARAGSTISARVLGIFFPPISNMTHLLIIYVWLPFVILPNLAMAHTRRIFHPLFVSPLAKGEIKWGLLLPRKNGYAARDYLSKLASAFL